MARRHFPHSVDTGAMWSFDRIEDANVELVIHLPGLSDLPIPGTIRAHVGATVRFAGPESMLYAGLSWTFKVPGTPVFVEGTFGGALHNGALSGAVWPDRNLGCPLLFRESASLGFDLTDSAAVMLTVEHASHAGLCGNNNRGLTNMGVRVAVKF